MAAVSVTPSKPLVFLLMGLVSLTVWIPRRLLHLDAERPTRSVANGLISTALNLTAQASPAP